MTTPSQPAGSQTDSAALGYSAAILKTLESLSEAQLQSEVIEPILRAEGFSNVRDNSGPGEHGKDLVATKQELGRSLLFAIQIKKISFSGKATGDTSFAAAVPQMHQLVLEPAIDPTTNRKRKPDRAYYITPFAINRTAMESALSQVNTLEQRHISIIDGPILSDLIIKHQLFQVLARLGGTELQYRVQCAIEANVIHESAAFSLTTPLELNTIYVDAAVETGGIDIIAGAAECDNADGTVVATTTPSDADALLSLGKEWAVNWCILHAKRSKSSRARECYREISEFVSKIQKRLDASEALRDAAAIRECKETLLKLRELRVIELQCDVILTRAREAANVHLDDTSKASRLSEDDPKLIQLCEKGLSLSTSIRRLWSAPHCGQLLRRCLTINHRPASLNLERPRISAKCLLHARRPLLIRGTPGGGKTTLLRRLTQAIAKTRAEEIPVLLYIVRFVRNTAEYIIEACRQQLIDRGFRLTDSEFVRLLEEGRLSILADGLDEVGERAPAVYSSLRTISQNYPKCRLIVTARHSVQLPDWDLCLPVTLSPFNNEQLKQFYQNWFSASPSDFTSIMSWLAGNPKMKAAAQTPLIAALLGSLHVAGADMPSTEVHLYESRFDLLFGRWEHAKKIKMLPPNVRKRCLAFLAKAAYEMHSAQTRSTAFDELVSLADQYVDGKYYSTPESVVLDCVQRGALEQEITGEVTFGHLTYQEFMAARWLSEFGDCRLAWDRMHIGWWHNVIRFYCAIKQDVGQLINEGMASRSKSMHFTECAKFLLSQRDSAPLTARGLWRDLSRAAGFL